MLTKYISYFSFLICKNVNHLLRKENIFSLLFYLEKGPSFIMYEKYFFISIFYKWMLTIRTTTNLRVKQFREPDFSTNDRHCCWLYWSIRNIYRKEVIKHQLDMINGWFKRHLHLVICFWEGIVRLGTFNISVL